VVAASAGHRADAFDAARFCIDTLKTGVPIWKRERWAGGEDWGLDAHQIMEIGT
jgi:molybdopterin synthase catalytic subunit